MLDPEIAPEVFLQYRRQPVDPEMPALVLLDVREPWEFQAASLPDSLLMPMGDVSSRAHQELDPDASIVVLCHHGMRSLNVALWLRAQGFERAQPLAGGIDAWSRAIDPTISCTRRVPDTTLRLSPRAVVVCVGQKPGYSVLVEAANP